MGCTRGPVLGPFMVLILMLNTLLMQMCQWGMYWDAPEAVAQCLDHFCRLDKNTLRASHINSILELPLAIHSMPKYPCVELECCEWLIHHFSDVTQIIQDKERYTHFCALGGAAIRLWAGLDDLVAVSENEVAVALTFWHHAQRRRGDQDGLERELSRLVRVSQMTKSFRWVACAARMRSLL